MAQPSVHLTIDDNTPPAAWRLLKFLLTPAPLEHLIVDAQVPSYQQVHQAQLTYELDCHLSTVAEEEPSAGGTLEQEVLRDALVEELGKH